MMSDCGDYPLSIGDTGRSRPSSRPHSLTSSPSPRRRRGISLGSPSRPTLSQLSPELTSTYEEEEEELEPSPAMEENVNFSFPDDQQIKSQCSRIVLSFQYRLTDSMVGRWIDEYNLTSGRKLKWLEPLPNYLHLVEIEDDNSEYLVDIIAEESPLESMGIFAAVNPFNPTFMSEKPKSLRQIVTVLISNQFLFNQLVFNLADLILAPVGKVVGKQFRKNKKGTRIEAVVETSRDSFVTEIEVPLLDTQSLILELDYVGLSDAQDRSLLGKGKEWISSFKPKKGLKPAPPCGSLSCFSREKACISIDV